MDLLKVADYMNRHPVTFTAEMPVEMAVDRLIKGRQTGGPVIDEHKKIIGLPFQNEPLKGYLHVHHNSYSSLGYSIIRNIKEYWFNKSGEIKNIRKTDFDEIIKNKEKTVLSREESLARLNDAVLVVEGANLVRNEYGHKLFANFFFFITGFHGFHVFSGVIINIIIFFNVLLGTYEKRKSYEMVEKVGLYWHFVDLVWVFVFTFFYLV